MNNTHTLEDSLEEGEARKIAMLGQSDDTPSAQNEFNAVLRATPAYVRVTVMISSIGLLSLAITGYVILITGFAIFYLPSNIIIGNEVFSLMFIFYALLVSSVWASYIITSAIYRSARRVYINGTRGYFHILMKSIANSFNDVVFSTVVVFTSVIFFVTLGKFILCIASNNYCPYIGFGW